MFDRSPIGLKPLTYYTHSTNHHLTTHCAELQYQDEHSASSFSDHSTNLEFTMKFSCQSHGCKESYDTAGGLANHRRACVAYKVHKKRALLRRQRGLLTRMQVSKLIIE